MLKNNKSKIPVLILIGITLLIIFSKFTNAAIQPGTIQKSSTTGSGTCSNSTSSYVTSASCVDSSTCDTYKDGTTCDTYKDGTTCDVWKDAEKTICDTYEQVCDTYEQVCDTYKTEVSETSSSYTNYSDKKTTIDYSITGTGIIKISDRSCTISATGTDSGKGTGTKKTCDLDSSTYYTSASNGSCSVSSTDNLIDTYTQKEGFKTKTTSSAEANGSCKVEGLYATEDVDVEDPTISGDAKSVFELDDDEIWCNIKKYSKTGDYDGGTYDKDSNPGCEKYKSLNNTIKNDTGQTDLLKGLSINIPGDVSGIGKVTINLGTCSGTLEISDKSLGNILVSPDGYSTTTVKSKYKDAFTITYNTDFTFGGETKSKGLLGLFNKSRLDACLGSGKNYLTVKTQDMAVNTSLVNSPNTSSEVKIGPILIDNGRPDIIVEDDFYNYLSDSNNKWSNKSLLGNIKIKDIKIPEPPVGCYNIKRIEDGECTITKPETIGDYEAGIFTYPTGVDSETGIFPRYKCDSLDSYPSVSDCRVGCKEGFLFDKVNNKCIQSICNQGITENGITEEIQQGGNKFGEGNFTESDVSLEQIIEISGVKQCLPFCIPGHSGRCIVKTVTIPNSTVVSTNIPKNLPFCTAGGTVECIAK